MPNRAEYFRQFFGRSKNKAILVLRLFDLYFSQIPCTISFRIAKISLVWQQGLKLRWNIDVRFHLRLEFQIEDQIWLKTVWIVDMSDQNYPSCVWSILILYKLEKILLDFLFTQQVKTTEKGWQMRTISPCPRKLLIL